MARKKKGKLPKGCIITAIVGLAAGALCGCPAIGLVAVYVAKPDLFAEGPPPPPDQQRSQLETKAREAAEEMKSSGRMSKLKEMHRPISRSWFTQNFGAKGAEYYENIESWGWWSDAELDKAYDSTLVRIMLRGDPSRTRVDIIDPGWPELREISKFATSKITFLQVTFDVGDPNFAAGMAPLVYAHGGFRVLPVDKMLKKKK
jgi:hypothetical protein